MSPKKKVVKKELKEGSTSRPHYHTGQRLEPENLTMEQEYHTSRRTTKKKAKAKKRK